MRLGTEEYSIDGDNITISRKVLQEWAEHYHNVAHSMPTKLQIAFLYLGKETVLLDILKNFEKEEI